MPVMQSPNALSTPPSTTLSTPLSNLFAKHLLTSSFLMLTHRLTKPLSTKLFPHSFPLIMPTPPHTTHLPISITSLHFPSLAPTPNPCYTLLQCSLTFGKSSLFEICESSHTPLPLYKTRATLVPATIRTRPSINLPHPFQYSKL